MGIFIFLLGVIVGSFLNVCIYRIPKEKSIIYPQSSCPECSTPLNWYNLIPIVSYLIQGGKCGYCGEDISPQYPIIEFSNAILYLALYYKFKLSIDFIFYGVIFSILIVITLIDLYHQIIPDILNISILVIAILYKIIQFITVTWHSNILDGILGLLISGFIFLLIAIMSKGNMGGGDIKLIAVLGLILGIRKSLLNIFISFLSGAVISIFLLLFKIKNKKDAIAFGPFICLAFVITVFWGEEILYWYFTMNQRLYY